MERKKEAGGGEDAGIDQQIDIGELVAPLIKLSKSTIRRMAAAGELPQPISLGHQHRRSLREIRQFTGSEPTAFRLCRARMRRSRRPIPAGFSLDRRDGRRPGRGGPGSGATDPGGEPRDLAGDGGDHVVEVGPEDAGGGDADADEDG